MSISKVNLIDISHYTSDESKFCILKTKCVPSQRISMKQYDVWVISCKNKGDFIGGRNISWLLYLHSRVT